MQKNWEGNTQKTLKCDDECARLERNRKIALALEIDPATHKDDHVPYSQDTLKLFQENSKWAQTQERLLRAFSNDDSEKRLRLKPMPPHQRAFLRSLAEDYGFDSESMDPEPHRHVAIFKTPRFVMAPMKTLSQCVEINIGATTATELQKRSAAAATASSNNIDTPFNSFLLGNPRFGLTVEELQSTLAPVLASRLNIPHALSINFLPSEEIVLKPTFNTDLTTSTLNAPTSPSIESLLRNQVSHLKSVTTSPPNQLATSLQLCHVDASFNVLRREVDASSAGGWSQVAAKAAWGHVPPRAPEPRRVGGGTVFTMLGKIGKGSEAAKKTKKAKVTEPVVEDWERAEEEEERMEETDKRRSSSPGDDTEDRVGGTTTGDDEEKGGVADAAIPSTIGQ
ncbi:MAG: FKBP12-associated protein [Sclerophora amabilis]|nr:MAG: FKBP12-associated protein [Sclerophora amabilis]